MENWQRKGYHTSAPARREMQAGSLSRTDSTDRCPICLDSFQNPKTLPRCNHKFCQICIDQAFKVLMVCPVCKLPYGVSRGNQPAGMMTWKETSSSLPGYEGYGTIAIDYSFQSGIQGREHPNPGVGYSGTSRRAYLPNNPEGRQVRDLLKQGFDARLLFTVGTSRTTGLHNQVTWNDIHHKTSTHGGSTSFGYPDPHYLSRVKEELAARGIH